MGPGLFFDKKKYISAKEASTLSGYSKDYIGQLAREKKIVAKRIGRTWYVSEDSLLNYKDFSNSYKKILKKNFTIQLRPNLNYSRPANSS